MESRRLPTRADKDAQDEEKSYAYRGAGYQDQHGNMNDIDSMSQSEREVWAKNYAKGYGGNPNMQDIYDQTSPSPPKAKHPPPPPPKKVPSKKVGVDSNSAEGLRQDLEEAEKLLASAK